MKIFGKATVFNVNTEYMSKIQVTNFKAKT